MRYELTRNSCQLCQDISNISTTVETIGQEIQNCENEVNTQNINNAKALLENILRLYVHFKKTTIDTILKLDGIYLYNWKKILLTAEYNLEFVKSIKNQILKLGFKKLKRLQNHIIDYFEIGYEVTCNDVTSHWTSYEINYFRNLTSPFQRPSSPLKQPSNIIQHRDVSIDSYNNFFNTISDFIEELVQYSESIDDELLLFWDGLQMKLKDAFQMYDYYTFDHLQGNYEYFRFFVRWILAVMYSRLRDVFVGIINYQDNDFYLHEDAPSNLEEKFELFITLPLFIDKPVKQTLNIFVDILTSYDGNDKRNLERYVTFLDEELENLGVGPISAYNTSNTVKFTERLNTVGFLVDILIEMYAKHEPIIKSAIEIIGINPEDPIMMLREWHK